VDLALLLGVNFPGYLVGVVVGSTPSGAGVVDPAVWLCLHRAGERTQLLVAAEPDWRRCGPAAVLANAIAAITTMPFGGPPDGPTSTPRTSEWRAAMRSKPGRRALERGAVTGVHLLDVPRMNRESHVDPDLASAYLANLRLMRPHWRRGHWQRYRLARRDDLGTVVGDVQGVEGEDWNYALRWIAPLRVNAARDTGARAREPLSVYRLKGHTDASSRH
jgi:hypothetical protein